MRYLSLLLIITFIMISSGCTSNDAADINELTELMNENKNININLSTIITVKKKYTEYTYIYNEHVLLQSYADDNGHIIACSITSDRQDSETTYELVSTVLKALCKADEEITNDFTSNQTLKLNGWNLEYNENPIADYYIIYNDEFEFNSEDLPKIKNFIKN